jgi:cell division protein FtsW (lipid II flippase)
VSAIIDRLKEIFGAHAGWLALLSSLALTTIGLLAIQTASPLHAADQTRWFAVAIVVMILAMLPHPRQVSLAAVPLGAITLALLILVILPFTPYWLVPVRNGARSWIDLRIGSFQPSELAKIAFVIAIARYLRFRENYRTLGGLLVPFVIALVPVMLILKEPDLGTAMLFAPALFVVLVAAGAKLRHLFSLLGLAVLVIALNIAAIYYLPDSMQILKKHQRDRITSMISLAQNESRYVQTTAFQQNKAITLVGAGQANGYGADRSAVIVKFNKLPEAHNDMIFAVIVNRWGFVGGAVTLGLYLLLVLSFAVIALRSKDPFTRLATIGFGGIIFTQAVINIGMTIGLLPITGITLPFISYGGSSLVTTFAIVGLVINFASRRPAIVARPSFEFDHADAIFQ